MLNIKYYNYEHTSSVDIDIAKQIKKNILDQYKSSINNYKTGYIQLGLELCFN